MALATALGENARPARTYTSISDFQQSRGYEPRGARQPAWRESVNESIERAKREAERIQDENLSRQRERDGVCKKWSRGTKLHEHR